MLKRLFGACVLILALIVTTKASEAQAPRIVAVGPKLVLLSNGDVRVRHDSCNLESTSWDGAFDFNIFSFAGETPGAKEMVGGVFVEGCFAWAISTGGDVYEPSACNYSCGARWGLVANIFDAAGWPRGTIAAIGSNFAASTTGDYFYYDARTGAWTFGGNTYGVVPTPANHATWGRLKLRYR